MCNHYHCSFSSHKAQIFKCNIASLHFPALRTFGKTVVPSEVPRQTLSVTLFQTVSRGRSSQQRPKQPAEAEAASRGRSGKQPAEPSTESTQASRAVTPNTNRARSFPIEPDSGRQATRKRHSTVELLRNMNQQVHKLIRITPLLCCLHPSALRAADLLQIHARSPPAPCAWMEGGGLGELARDLSRCSI